LMRCEPVGDETERPEFTKPQGQSQKVKRKKAPIEKMTGA
jgi:hypothetical protein